MALPSRLSNQRGNVQGRRKSDWTDMTSLQSEVNRIFDTFFSGLGVAPYREMEPRFITFSPKVDISENEKEMIVTAECPGMEEKDISVSLEEDHLVLSGERKEEKKEEDEHYRCREMAYGSFQRAIPLSAQINADKVEAKFKNGILKVVLPKIPESKKGKGKRIEIKSK